MCPPIFIFYFYLYKWFSKYFLRIYQYLIHKPKERRGKQERERESERDKASDAGVGAEWSERESKGWSSTRENCYNVPQYGVVSCELAPRQWKTSGLRERHRPKCILSEPWSVLYRRLPIRHFHSPKSSCSRFFFYFFFFLLRTRIIPHEFLLRFWTSCRLKDNDQLRFKTKKLFIMNIFVACDDNIEKIERNAVALVLCQGRCSM